MNSKDLEEGSETLEPFLSIIKFQADSHTAVNSLSKKKMRECGSTVSCILNPRTRQRSVVSLAFLSLYTGKKALVRVKYKLLWEFSGRESVLLRFVLPVA